MRRRIGISLIESWPGRRAKLKWHHMRQSALFILLALATCALAQTNGTGKYPGKLSSNPVDPYSVSNPIGICGSPVSPNSINNPVGIDGSPVSPYSARNNRPDHRRKRRRHNNRRLQREGSAPIEPIQPIALPIVSIEPIQPINPIEPIPPISRW